MKVRFEPIGEVIECALDETVLDAAFRQGLNLVHGCREGQCSACKCFLMEGEVALRRYSNFALSDSELSSGYSLMCRAMPEQDLVVELLHYDADNYRLEHAIRDGEAVIGMVGDAAHHRIIGSAVGEADDAGGKGEQVEQPDCPQQRQHAEDNIRLGLGAADEHQRHQYRNDTCGDQ